MPKHEGQETVASLDSQNPQTGASDEVAAPQLGQLSVSACIGAFDSRSRHKRSCIVMRAKVATNADQGCLILSYTNKNNARRGIDFEERPARYRRWF